MKMAKTVKLTDAEFEMLHALAGNLYGRVAMENLKPAARAMAKRMRQKGLLSKRHLLYASLTQVGYAAMRPDPQ
jgi:hypothetical protein